MNITVYLGSEYGVNPVYKEKAAELGRWIGSNGHSLVYGGGNVGLMGVLADSVLASGGKVIGVIPDFFIEIEQQHDGLTELEVVSSMSERKRRMVELGDFFIAFPGGIGTLEEIAEIMTRKKLHIGSEDYVFYNIDGYYDCMRNLLDKMCSEGFLSENARSQVLFVSDFEQLEKTIKVVSQSLGLQK